MSLLERKIFRKVMAKNHRERVVTREWLKTYAVPHLPGLAAVPAERDGAGEFSSPPYSYLDVARKRDPGSPQLRRSA
jgi:hypothetical protein